LFLFIAPFSFLLQVASYLDLEVRADRHLSVKWKLGRTEVHSWPTRDMRFFEFNGRSRCKHAHANAAVVGNGVVVTKALADAPP